MHQQLYINIALVHVPFLLDGLVCFWWRRTIQGAMVHVQGRTMVPVPGLKYDTSIVDFFLLWN